MLYIWRTCTSEAYFAPWYAFPLSEKPRSKKVPPPSLSRNEAESGRMDSGFAKRIRRTDRGADSVSLKKRFLMVCSSHNPVSYHLTADLPRRHSLTRILAYAPFHSTTKTFRSCRLPSELLLHVVFYSGKPLHFFNRSLGQSLGDFEGTTEVCQKPRMQARAALCAFPCLVYSETVWQLLWINFAN